MRKEKTKLLLVDLFLVVVLVMADQLTKLWAIGTLKDKPAIELIKGVFELHYLENRGAAFGMLQGQKVFFVIITMLIVTAIIWFLIKLPDEKKYYKLQTTLVFVMGGAIGNFIDRIRYNYVVDFLYFKLIDFPIFNVADIYVTVSAVVLMILLLFVYKESDFEFMNRR